LDASISQLARDTVQRLRELPVVDAASLRRVRRELSVQVKTVSPRDAIYLALQIITETPPGAYPLVYELLRYHPTAISELRPDDLDSIGENMSGWGEVDSFAGLAGLAWRNCRISDSVVHNWAQSPNRWWRRAALASTVPLNIKSQGGEGDAARTLAVCGLLIDDRDDMVVKAMSWALRALATREPEPVARFVDKHERDLAARVIREVRNKLRTGRKDGKPASGVADRPAK